VVGCGGKGEGLRRCKRIALSEGLDPAAKETEPFFPYQTRNAPTPKGINLATTVLGRGGSLP